MAKTLLDLDENLLAEAGSALGTSTKKETVMVALQRAVDDARARRAHGMEQLLAIADAGGIEYDRMDDLDS